LKASREIHRARNKHSGKRGWRALKGLEVAAAGCLLAGGYDILMAVRMPQASDVLLCLFGSFGACGLVCYLYFNSR
jgi:hypothetical protein